MMKKKRKIPKKGIRQKKGLSSLLTTIFLVLIGIVAVSILFSVSINYLKEKAELSSVHAELVQETAKIKRVVIDPLDNEIMDITFCCAKGDSSDLKGEEEKIEIKELDIGLVIDRSGSMMQSGWNLIDNGANLINEALNLNVPYKDYSSSVSFNVPLGTERLAVLLTWGQEPGYTGSEGSEFALNLKNPSGTWIYGSGQPALSGIVDPPDNSGYSNDYFSGICTKPQVVYVENPEAGDWDFKVYGWNLRPKDGPPPSQDVNVSVYIGDSSQLNKTQTVLSLEAAKDSARNFVNDMRPTDYVSYTVFGSAGNAELKQSLTGDQGDLLAAIDNTGQQGGTGIQTGISTSQADLNSKNRPGAEKIMVILTDGQNDAGPQVVIDAATAAKNDGINIYTIGLTGFVDEDMLRSVATDPSYYYYAPDSSVLASIFDSVRQRIVTESVSATLSEGFQVVFRNGTHSYTPPLSTVLLSPLETKTFHFDLNGKIENVTIIEIYAVKIIRDRPIIGPLIQSYEIH